MNPFEQELSLYEYATGLIRDRMRKKVATGVPLLDVMAEEQGWIMESPMTPYQVAALALTAIWNDDVRGAGH